MNSVNELNRLDTTEEKFNKHESICVEITQN
jgi:hypothetical protein